MLGAGTPDDLDGLDEVGSGIDPILDAYRTVKAAHAELKANGISMNGHRESCAPCIQALLVACEALADLEGVDEEGLGKRMNAVFAIRFNMHWFKEPGCKEYASTPRHRRVDASQFAAEVPRQVAASGEVPEAVLPLGAWHVDGGPVRAEDCLGSSMALVELALDAVELELREALSEHKQRA